MIAKKSRNNRVLIVGNYLPDEQQSMIRFADLLVYMYKSSAQVCLVAPASLITRLPGLPSLASKYLAYVDKLLIFPLWLYLRSRSFDLVHIADHSNAFYSFCCPSRVCIVTCHDMLAIRAAFGDSAAACNTSVFGIWLQRLITVGLRRSSAVAFDSQATFFDYKQLIGVPLGQRHAVIPIPLNAPFTPQHSAFTLSDTEQGFLPTLPYLLMVGSALPRKNRARALKLLEWLGEPSPYWLVFAGAPLSPAEQVFQKNHQFLILRLIFLRILLNYRLYLDGFLMLKSYIVF